MGTRGLMGFRIDGKDKVTYNHFDSYPDGLGESVVQDVKTLLQVLTMDELKDKARKIKLVDEDSVPTPEDFLKLDLTTRLLVQKNGGLDKSWCSLLHGLQGELLKTLEAGVMIDSIGFINDSLFCEWAYIVNLDEETLEIYRGFQEKPHTFGRYATNTTASKYYPCAIVATFSLTDIPENWTDRVKEDDE